MQIVVCQLFQLARIDNEISKEHKKLIRPRAVITTDYMETVNNNYKDSGKWYEVDEKATATYFATAQESKELKEMEKEIDGEEAVKALKKALKVSTKKAE